MAGQEHDISSLEEAVNNASEVLREINDGNMLPDILEIIRQPGWTTPAEFVFVSSILVSLEAQVESLAALKTNLLEGSRQISAAGARQAA
jgi:hypothetical protein